MEKETEYTYKPRDRYRVTVKDINQTKRPQLATAIKGSYTGEVYALKDLPPQRHDTGKRIVLLQIGATATTLISDEIIGEEEYYKAFVLTPSQSDRMGKILMDETFMNLVKEIELLRRKPSPNSGRPRKYLMTDIICVIKLHESGMSIRNIAKSLHMSPTTVQKLMKYKDIKETLIAINGEYKAATDKSK